MANVTPGFTFSSTTPITSTALNLLGQPTVTVGTNELTLSTFPTASANNTFIARYTTGSGNYEALVTTTTGLGFYTGAGGVVTQATDKTTGVTLDKMCGQITMNAANLGATTAVAFTLTNSKIATTDVVLVSIDSGATASSYTVTVDAVGAGSCRISLRNFTGGGLAEAVVLNFIVLKAVAA